MRGAENQPNMSRQSNKPNMSHVANTSDTQTARIVRHVAGAALALSALASLPLTADAQSWTSRELSSGACMVACEDVGFCLKADYDRGSGICSLVLDSSAPGFQLVRSRCPLVEPGSWQMTFSASWRLDCPSGGSTAPPGSQAPGFEGEGLEDVP